MRTGNDRGRTARTGHASHPKQAGNSSVRHRGRCGGRWFDRRIARCVTRGVNRNCHHGGHPEALLSSEFPTWQPFLEPLLPALNATSPRTLPCTLKSVLGLMPCSVPGYGRGCTDFVPGVTRVLNRSYDSRPMSATGRVDTTATSPCSMTVGFALLSVNTLPKEVFAKNGRFRLADHPRTAHLSHMWGGYWSAGQVLSHVRRKSC
jgi:hypothetical protein